jgi:hypothetical protein
MVKGFRRNFQENLERKRRRVKSIKNNIENTYSLSITYPEYVSPGVLYEPIITTNIEM